MDTKRVNIYAGSILGGLLLFLLLGFFANLIYHGPEHAGGEDEVLAYALEVQDTGEGAGDEAEEVNLAALAAEADPDAGASVFNKCKACHSLEEGDHAVGPALNNVLGADIASAEGFDYTDALTGLEGDWDLESLSAFLENPQDYAPGTKMSFAGIGDPEDRVDVIAYLNEAGDSPVDLVPEGAETAAAETETETDATDEAAEGEEAAGEAAEGDQEVAAEEGAEPATEEGAEQPTEEGAEQPTEEGAEQPTEEGAEPATEEGAEQPTEEGAEPATEEGAGDQAGGEFAELLAQRRGGREAASARPATRSRRARTVSGRRFTA